MDFPIHSYLVWNIFILITLFTATSTQRISSWAEKSPETLLFSSTLALQSNIAIQDRRYIFQCKKPSTSLVLLHSHQWTAISSASWARGMMLWLVWVGPNIASVFRDIDEESKIMTKSWVKVSRYPSKDRQIKGFRVSIHSEVGWGLSKRVQGFKGEVDIFLRRSNLGIQCYRPWILIRFDDKDY